MKEKFIRKITLLLLSVITLAVFLSGSQQNVKASNVRESYEGFSSDICEGTQVVQTKNSKADATTKVKFKKKTLWAFSNGGFYLKVNSVKGRKMNVSIHMPQMNGYNLQATIDSSGKKAKAYCSCSSGGYHVLTFRIAGSGIKVTEKTHCYQKLLGWKTSDRYKTTITHGFYPQSHFY